jgi:LPS sulfotransferase NodH
MNKIEEIFEQQDINQELIRELEKIVEPTTKYIIAMTPRSGSSHLCDVMKNTELFGSPGEFLPAEFIPKILLRAPANNADDYLVNVLKVLQSANGVSGVKTSWFQFQLFCGALKNRSVIRKFKYIYLVRRDVAAQAVSLYRATESSFFHTNINHSEVVINKNEQLEYDYEKINKWHKHIIAQEDGWQNYFSKNGIFPLYITYEDIESDVAGVVKRIAAYIGLPPGATDSISAESIFKKIGNRKNVEWTCKFVLENDEQVRSADNRTKQTD